MGSLQPWEIHPALTLERIQVVGSLLWLTRQRVALRMEREEGDTLWGAGCAAYERNKAVLAKASKGEYREWLSITPSEHHFVIAIGGVPCRFYRGKPDQPAPVRYATPTKGEKDALQFAFSLVDTPTPEFVFRFEVEIDADGFPVRVSLLQVDREGERHNVFAIPGLPLKSLQKAAPRPKRRQAVQLPAPVVTSLRDEQAAKRARLGDSAS